MYKRPTNAQELSDYFIEHLSFLNEKNWSAQKVIDNRHQPHILNSWMYKCLILDIDWAEGHMATATEARATIGDLDYSIPTESTAELIDGASVVVDGQTITNKNLTDELTIKAVLSDPMNLSKFILKQ